MVFVEGAALLIHERIARPGLGHQHHGRVGQRVAALGQEFERVVEAGGVRLAFIGDGPQLGDVGAEQLGVDGRLTRRHPVDVAAQGVDLAVVRHHPVGVGQRPGREGVGGEALVHEGERALEVRVVQVGVIGAQLVGQEHALVDQRATRQRHRVIAGGARVLGAIDGVGDHLAQHEQAALEAILVAGELAAADEHLGVLGLGGQHAPAEGGIVGGHVAPAEDDEAFLRHRALIGGAHDLLALGIAGQEDVAYRIEAGLRQGEAEPRRFLQEELVGDLHQHARAVAGTRVGAHGAAVLQVEQDVDAVLDDAVGLAALDVGDEADAAGILFMGRVEQAERFRSADDRRVFHGGGRPSHASVQAICAIRRCHLVVPSVLAARQMRPAVLPQLTPLRLDPGFPRIGPQPPSVRARPMMSYGYAATFAPLPRRTEGPPFV